VAASDIVCLATTTPDPLPRVVLEAMGAGRPVAAYDSGGAREMVLHEGTGLLVPAGEVQTLAECLVRLARDPALRQSMGRAARRRAEADFSLDRHVARMETLFERLAR
jgi:glycosyltransferase involved in cell wall biosynthesis